MKKMLTTLVAASLLAATSGAMAQDYPSKSINLVLPTTAGTSMDTLGRFLAEGLSKKWGQTVVTENRPGAGSALGSAYVATSASDGYTLLLVSSAFSTNALSPDLPYDAVADFKPVAMVARGDMGIVGGTRIPAATLGELVEYAKNNTVFYGTTGPTAASRFATDILADVAGITMEPVTYPGAPEALIDIGGQRLDVYVGAVATIMPSLSETIMPLAVLGTKRSAAWPDVPTVSEAGFPGAEFDLYWGVFAPTGIPDDIATKINSDINEIMTSAAAADYIERLGAYASPMSVDEFSQYVVDDIAKLAAVAAAD